MTSSQEVPARHRQLQAATDQIEQLEAEQDAVGPRGCRRYFSTDRILCKTHRQLRDCLAADAASASAALTPALGQVWIEPGPRLSRGR